MLRFFVIVSMFAGCATPQVASSGVGSYPIEELKALDAQESYAELLSHVLDVAPTKRNDEWLGLLDKAASSTLAAATGDIKDSSSAEAALAKADALVMQYPALKKAPKFMGTRADIAVKSFGWVLQSSRSREWVERIAAFAEKDTVTPKVAQRLAKEVVLGRLIPVAAYPLYELAFKRDGAAVCKEPEVQKMILDAVQEDSMGELATKTCWAELKQPILDLLKSAPNRVSALKICKVLAPRAAEVGDAMKEPCKEL